MNAIATRLLAFALFVISACLAFSFYARSSQQKVCIRNSTGKMINDIVVLVDNKPIFCGGINSGEFETYRFTPSTDDAAFDISYSVDGNCISHSNVGYITTGDSTRHTIELLSNDYKYTSSP